MKQPLVTIGITSYNHAKYIVYALNSVLQEDYPNKEIVIIDDGSTDNSAELIQAWVAANKDKIEVTFISRPNKGLAFTLNELLNNVLGDYLALLASDDAFCNNGIAKRMKALLETNKMVAVGDCTVIDNHNITTHQSWMKDVMKRDVNNYNTDEGIMREVLVNPAISGSVLLIDKKVYKKIGTYPQNFFAEEWFFYQRCAANKDIVYIDEVVSLYRRHEDNTSGKLVANRKHLVKSIVKSYGMNWWLFPGIKMKFLALKQWVRWNYIYLRTYILK